MSTFVSIGDLTRALYHLTTTTLNIEFLRQSFLGVSELPSSLEFEDLGVVRRLGSHLTGVIGVGVLWFDPCKGPFRGNSVRECGPEPRVPTECGRDRTGRASADTGRSGVPTAGDEQKSFVSSFCKVPPSFFFLSVSQMVVYG